MKITYYEIIPDGLLEPMYYLGDEDWDLEVGRRVLIPVYGDESISEGTIINIHTCKESKLPLPMQEMHYIYDIDVDDDEDEDDYYDDDFDDFFKLDADDYGHGPEFKLVVNYLNEAILKEDFEAIRDFVFDTFDHENEQFYEIAFDLMNYLIDKQDLLSILTIGHYLYNNKELDRNYELSYNLFAIAKELGSIPGIAMIGKMYYYGQFVEEDKVMAYKLFTKVLAIDEFDSDAAYLLAKMYAEGEFVETDIEYAISLCFKAVDQCEKNDDNLPFIHLLLGKLLYEYHDSLDLMRVAYDNLIESKKLFVLNYPMYEDADDFIDEIDDMLEEIKDLLIG